MSAVAVIGLACRYPEADSPQELWENVLAQRRSFRRLPPERLRLEDYHSPDPRTPDAIYADHAALIEDWEFDRVAYRISGPTFRATDLTHWLALDVAQRALDDARFDDLRPLERDRVAVVVGNTLTGEFTRSGVMRVRWPYVRRVVGEALQRNGMDADERARVLATLEADYKAPFPPVGEDSLAGALSNTIAGRICNRFDFHGGGYTVDGACASSLLAVANGCTALTTGDSDVVLAGGVDLSIDPFELVGFAKTGALAPDLMRIYDRRSAGFWPGEGCGFVVLARLEDALDWHVPVHAVIRGWGVSSDGRGGITRPELAGQLLAIRRAYARAGYEMGSVGLFEGHGTGTAVGDATEIRALGNGYAEAGGAGGAALGSIKANIGHTKAAAGVAGLLKAVLSVERGVLPPTTGCEEPHDELDNHRHALRILREPEAWPEGTPVRAGVSAMGFGGVNSHVTLEAAGERSVRGLSRRERALATTFQDAELIPLAADDLAGLAGTARELAAVALGLSFGQLRDLAIDRARHAPAGRFRGAIVASRPAELAERAARLADSAGEGRPASLDERLGFLYAEAVGEPRIGFLFPGQAAPTYRDGGALGRRFAAAREIFAAGLPPHDLAPADTRVAQPAIVACSTAAEAVLSDLGIAAVVGLGHSLGELTALGWAGALDRNDVAQLAALRGLAMAECSGSGAMAELGTTPEVARELADGLAVVPAAFNADERTVMSGPEPAVAALVRRAEDRGVRAVRLPVSHAFHSPQMAPAAGPLGDGLAALEIASPRRRVVSTVTGAPLNGSAPLPALLVEQLTAPVRFVEAIAAARDEVDLWIEAGPGQILTGLARGAGAAAVATDAGGPSLAGLLTAVAAAWVRGAPVALDRLGDGRVPRDAEPLRARTFLANPCELAPQPDSDPVLEAPSSDASAEAVATGDAPDDVVRALVAARAELPVETVEPEARLLTDLNLTSITIAEIAAEAAGRLGVRPLLAPTELADATVADLARMLAESEPDDGEASGPPPGVAAWLRPFTVEWEPTPAPRGERTPCAWRLVAPADHPLRAELEAAFGGDAADRGVLVAPAPGRSPEHAAWLLDAVKTVLAEEPSTRVLVLHDGQAGGIARSLFLEDPRRTVSLVELPGLPTRDRLALVRAAAETGDGFAEARLDESGGWSRPVMRRVEIGAPDPSPPLQPGDVIVASGAGRGIGAEATLALARATGAAVAILGRSDPEQDAELRENLERFERAGVRTAYVRADVGDAGAVRAAVTVASERLGPVTAILHAAGTNEPRLLVDLDHEQLAGTLRPKVDGLANLLAAVEQPRLLVAFGSIIARSGMAGEGHYALANEWLRLDVDDVARRLPGCRAVTLEYSVWAGAGMGERLGRVEALARSGVMPIAPDDGVALLAAVASAHEVPSAIVACGRVGDSPVLSLERAELPLTRFVERPVVHYPRTELVVETTLSLETDPYLVDHALDGVPLVPAVVGLEAMAQVAAALVDGAPSAFEDVRLQRPITVPADGERVLRIAALAHDEHAVEVAIRSDETGFEVDHFRAVVRVQAREAPGPATPGVLEDRIPLGDELYGRLLFHGPRFQRVDAYRHLSARRCLADVCAHPDRTWFGTYLPQTLLLGDFGARDAFIHAAQACIPHRRVLPISVERIELGGPLAGRCMVDAVERRSDETELVYDVVIRDAGGVIVERWTGLTLRALAPLPAPSSWTPSLFGPYLERRVGELLEAEPSPAAVLVNGGEARSERSAAAARQLAGPSAQLRHRGDGKPELDDGTTISIAHDRIFTLAVTAPGRVACDVEHAVARSRDAWQGLLGEARLGLAERVATEAGESLELAATRLWVVGECLRKAGRPPGEPVVLDRLAGDGWAVMRAGSAQVAVGAARLAGAEEPVVVGVLAQKETR